MWRLGVHEVSRSRTRHWAGSYLRKFLRPPGAPAGPCLTAFYPGGQTPRRPRTFQDLRTRLPVRQRAGAAWTPEMETTVVGAVRPTGPLPGPTSGVSHPVSCFDTTPRRRHSPDWRSGGLGTKEPETPGVPRPVTGSPFRGDGQRFRTWSGVQDRSAPRVSTVLPFRPPSTPPTPRTTRKTTFQTGDGNSPVHPRRNAPQNPRTPAPVDTLWGETSGGRRVEALFVPPRTRARNTGPTDRT